MYLVRPSYRQQWLAAVCAVLMTLLIIGIVLSVYRQWQLVAEQVTDQSEHRVLASLSNQSLAFPNLSTNDNTELTNLSTNDRAPWSLRT